MKPACACRERSTIRILARLRSRCLQCRHAPTPLGILNPAGSTRKARRQCPPRRRRARKDGSGYLEGFCFDSGAIDLSRTPHLSGHEVAQGELAGQLAHEPTLRDLRERKDEAGQVPWHAEIHYVARMCSCPWSLPLRQQGLAGRAELAMRNCTRRHDTKAVG